ncbi:PKD domain-containing protein [uncultured Chitinophaga sp.]|uniref:PKD domain-containing protein n=1 Tax=uncultured Chitinophaga sp. TaxID=339340 RepID=UPI0025D5049F|nr:PKD domain-containing protein [uncultured Chitinophaga sp.]
MKYTVPYLNLIGRVVWLALFALLFTSGAYAQVTAAFDLSPGSVASGCAPLVVSFKNTSVGATSVSWDFGNGVTSDLMGTAGASFPNPGVYTVKLVAKGASGTTSEAVKTITVYKNPVADFSFDVSQGCVPLGVNFADKSAPGDGAIVSYAWDFGDGAAGSGANPSHTYNYAQSYNVSLTVTTNRGCSNVKTISKAITVSPELKADFTVASTYLCAAPGTVPVTNLLTGPDLSYVWDFGDGTTSTLEQPLNHSYATKGSYTMKLDVTNSIGCKASKTFPVQINVANFSADFSIPPTICQNDLLTTTAVLSPVATSVNWMVDEYIVSTSNDLTTLMYSPGKHTITLSALFGACEAKVQKEIQVNPVPVADYVIENKPYCTLPITIKFTDNTPGATKWQWSSGAGETSVDKEPTFTFNAAGVYYPTLKVTNADGCSASQNNKTINISEPRIEIVASEPFNKYCEGANVSFGYTSTTGDIITSFEWDFGDGSPLSNDPSPVHTYPLEGKYPITLKYTTQDGCTGTISYFRTIDIYKTPKPVFTAPLKVCGNNPALFKDISLPPFTHRSWDWGDGTSTGAGLADQGHSFADGPGDFVVTLMLFNETCYEIAQQTVTVLAPYPKFNIGSVDCDKRMEVKITDATLGATSYKWDFGDGQTIDYNTPPAVPVVSHVYAQNGNYNITMTVSDGTCTSSLTKVVKIIAASPIVVTADKSTICRNDVVTLVAANDPSVVRDLYSWLYNGNGSYDNNYRNATKVYSNLDPGTAILKTYAYNEVGCIDSSHEIKVAVTGPVADFSFSNANICHGTPMIFTDATDTKYSAPLKTWTFNYGDGSKEQTYANAGPFSHIYDSAAYYTVTMRVTDETGCYHSATKFGQVVIKGPNADFTAPVIVGPGMKANIGNTTDVSLSTAPVTYKWDFGDGSTSIVKDPAPHTYTVKGIYNVTLTVKDGNGCTDTLQKQIKVSDVSADFIYTSAYVNPTSGCPPVKYFFGDKSLNAKEVFWDFGDGGTSREFSPEHTYIYSGVYKIKMSVTGQAGNTDEKEITIEIKGPKGSITASAPGGCLTKEITFNVQASNVTGYSWDFTDGQVKETTDKSIAHTFRNAGIYNPRLILGDGSGCKGVAYLDDPIIIDNLDLKLSTGPISVCDSGWFYLEVDYNSFSIDQQNMPGVYTWTLGDGLTMTGEGTPTPVLYGNKPGSPEVKLHVLTAFGCEQTVTQPLKVLQKPVVSFTGPLEACAEEDVLFVSVLTKADQSTTKWNWTFGTEGSGSVATPQAQRFTVAGNHDVRLIVTSDNGCMDTADHAINILPLPVVKVSASASYICLGESVSLTAVGGTGYLWDNAASLNNAAIATPVANPENTTTYRVTVTNGYGCEDTDEVTVRVVRPLTVSIKPVTDFCIGDPLLLHATGADHYIWTGDDLNDPTSPDPIARPVDAGIYTYKVTGSDNDGCFSDEEELSVTVQRRPTVNAGPDIITPGGAAVTLTPQTSNDIAKLNWTPSQYLDCSTCLNPQVLLNKSTVYTITVENAYGCKATDDVLVQLVCNQGAVFIPSAFTPNADGVNDLFFPKGSGIREIRSMRIYNRWGNLMYERQRFQVNDRSVGWDGTWHGRKAESGAYLYFIEAECEEKTLFEYKGVIMLVR